MGWKRRRPEDHMRGTCIYPSPSAKKQHRQQSRYATITEDAYLSAVLDQVYSIGWLPSHVVCLCTCLVVS